MSHAIYTIDLEHRNMAVMWQTALGSAQEGDRNLELPGVISSVAYHRLLGRRPVNCKL